jgi:hypothetical protein
MSQSMFISRPDIVRVRLSTVDICRNTERLWGGQALAQIVRHDLFHLVKSTGKLAQFRHELDHGFSPSTDQLVEEVVPDLLIYALQISNALDVDLGELYRKRIRDVELKLRRDGEDVG